MQYKRQRPQEKTNIFHININSTICTKQLTYYCEFPGVGEGNPGNNKLMTTYIVIVITSINACHNRYGWS